MTIRATVHRTASLAYQHAEASGEEPILLGVQHLTVPRAELERLEAAGVAFAHLCVHQGRLVTIPVND